ncbi:MAG TPA: glycosyltransferase [Terriglobia bacterium]|jgi:glycosyltransferase involved in cell wall biosynthesis
MRVAIIHDWLNGMRGGEKVLEGLLGIFPGATIYTLLHERGKVSAFIESHRIVTSWLNRMPGVYRHYRNFLPLFPAAIESFDLSEFDLIVSSSHSVAKGIRPGRAPHISYCHTPMRYVWDAEDDYRFGPARRLAMRCLRDSLQHWDCEAAGRVHEFIANSQFVRERIRSYYGRDAAVIYPPVDTQFFRPSTTGLRGGFYLAAGALVPYKRFDLIVEAFNRMGRRLIVAGHGSELARLRRIAGRNVEIRGSVSDGELRRLYQTAKGLVVAAREDFGIVSVEAQSCGCPVIAYGAGGSPEIIRDGINGILYAEQDADDIARAVLRADSMAWPAERVRHHVEAFSRETFENKIRNFISRRLETPSGIRAGRDRSYLQPA